MFKKMLVLFSLILCSTISYGWNYRDHPELLEKKKTTTKSNVTVSKERANAIQCAKNIMLETLQYPKSAEWKECVIETKHERVWYPINNGSDKLPGTLYIVYIKLTADADCAWSLTGETKTAPFVGYYLIHFFKKSGTSVVKEKTDIYPLEGPPNTLDVIAEAQLMHWPEEWIQDIRVGNPFK